MQSTDARILRGAVIPTSLAGLIAIAAGFLVSGGKGVLGATVGAALVLVFFTLGVLIVRYVAKLNQQIVMMAGLFSYLIKLVVVLGLVAALNHVTIWDAHIFGWTVIALTVVWLAAETNATLSAKSLYVEPRDTPRDLGKSDT
jgi:ATP synthase protein I